MTLSDKAANKNIILLDQLTLDEAKTKIFFKILQSLKLRSTKVAKSKDDKKVKKGGKRVKAEKSKEKSILVVLPSKDESINRSARNIPMVKTINAKSLNVYDVLKYQYLLMPVGAIEIIKKTFVKSI